jgi:4-hydroxy-2-oxoheptanedioate aldolase
MRVNRVKQKLKRGQPSIGTWLTTGHLHVARVLARSGFDWLTLDVEHAPYDWRETAAVVAAIADAGCVPLIRVPDGSHSWIKRALDAGAYGIVVPMVETVEQAQAAIDAAKYPPLGKRSAGGGMHNLNFDCSVEEYFMGANDQTLVILQTESPLGIENANEIYALSGCDAIFIGPNDLKFQMRQADGAFPSEEELEAAIQRILAVGRDLRKPIGMHVLNIEQADRRIGQGMQFLAVSSDLGMLNASARQIGGGLGLTAKADIARY